MNYNIIAVPNFKRELKRLSKKYYSIKSDLAILFKSLENDPTQGFPLGNDCFKIRMVITSKTKGKSGGARLITNFAISNSTIYLLSIYDKSEKENLSDKELKDILNGISK